jgi:hypothetical protein
MESGSLLVMHISNENLMPTHSRSKLQFTITKLDIKLNRVYSLETNVVSNPVKFQFSWAGILTMFRLGRLVGFQVLSQCTAQHSQNNQCSSLAMNPSKQVCCEEIQMLIDQVFWPT